MAKPFPNYPAGLRGAGICIARLSGAALVLLGSFFLAAPVWMEMLAVVTGLMLGFGLATRAAATVATGLLALASLDVGGVIGMVLVCNAVHVAAIGLVGGGAYSVDGLLFGRRVIRLPE